MYTVFALLVVFFFAPFVLIGRREHHDAADIAAAGSKIVSCNGQNVAVRDQGMGSVVVLLHGFGGWTCGWDRLQAALVASGYRVIAIDSIGAGASTRSLRPADYSTGAQANLVLAVLQRLGVEQVTLIGHSYGGRIALQMALYAPDRVNDIIAIAPEVHATARPPIAQIVTIPVLGYALAFWSTAPALMGLGLRSVCRRTAWLTPARAAQYAAPLHVRGHLAAQIVQSSAAKDSDMPVPVHYPHIHVPVHVIWGQHDPVFPASDGVRMVDHMRHCDLTVIPDCGHIPHEEAFAETYAAIQQHLPPRTVMIPSLQ